MRLVHPIVALAVAAAALAACERHNANTAYNNSGRSASTAPAAESPAPATTSSTTSDMSSPSVASTSSPQPTGASGAVSETVTSTKILAAIAAESGLKDSDINVTTANGVVTLGGSAKSQDQVALATNIAQRQEGVARVESNVQVR